MEARETTHVSACTHYGKPPWRFKGRYTLGGFFLASYDDSPAGVFDELVVIAGIVWNPPTSCAWASKVLVNSSEACRHGRKDVGLPSHVARFSKRITANTRQNGSGHKSILERIGLSSSTSSSRFHLDTEVSEISGSAASADNIFRINLLSAVPKESSKAWMGPAIKMSLPSFSGRTEHNPNLLKYSCQLECRVRVVQPLQIFGPSPMTEEKGSEDRSSNSAHQAAEETTEKTSRLCLSVMLSRPILALEFNCLNMNVEAPLVVSQ